MCHLADGRVVSCGMDSKMCLWSVEKRNAIEVVSIPVLSCSLSYSYMLDLFP